MRRALFVVVIVASCVPMDSSYWCMPHARDSVHRGRATLFAPSVVPSFSHCRRDLAACSSRFVGERAFCKEFLERRSRCQGGKISAIDILVGESSQMDASKVRKSASIVFATGTGSAEGNDVYFSDATSECLDWPLLWTRLISFTRTEAGRARMRDSGSQVCQNVADVMFVYNCIGELRSLRASRVSLGTVNAWDTTELPAQNSGRKRGEVDSRADEVLPLEGILDVSSISSRAAKGGVFEVPDVQRLCQTLPLLLLLGNALAHPAVDRLCPTIKHLWKSRGGGKLRSSVMAPFKHALDDQGQLNAETFSQIAKLRSRYSFYLIYW